ncbi:YtpR family tRNA-binding protein [Paenisporosarcina cavernae]|uniref:DUF4479 domain-containing protein n=1 Tax=Paenisporosarcina cavernae TaxID=2320858 RepID=A0A385YW07_9BACL|nr:DUF4479 domain-containing protein [Paenisporosarcina cavernae]AYC29878.1 DUF4479 domain-containing protein [Paenisporosarcina cavernae]
MTQAFYNNNGIGDVLLVQLNDTKPQEIITETKGDITLIKDEANTILGFNLFKASTYFHWEEQGAIEWNEEKIAAVKEALNKNNVSLTFEVDLSPKFVVGYIVSKDAHPNADKLSVCQVDVGEETVQIVCGAPNVAAGQKVVVAKVGAVMPSGMHIKDSELRGLASAGMICSAKELNLPNAPQEKGILVLEENAEIGSKFM